MKANYRREDTVSRIAVNSQSIPAAAWFWIVADSPLLCSVPARDSGKGQNRVGDELTDPLPELRVCIATPHGMPSAGGFLLCIRTLSFLFVRWKRIGIDNVSGDHDVRGMNIF